MKILFAGIIGRYPLGGVTWCSLMYLLGLRALGHEVFYVEDTGECIYDPEQNTRAVDPSYGTRYIDAALRPFDLGDRWSFVNYDGTYHGAPRARVVEYARDADLFINLSGGTWFWRDEYARIPRKIFVDSDPAFTQLAIAKREPWYVEFFRRFDRLFTFGSNIGTPTCDVPTGEFTWEKTWQPVVTSLWRTDRAPQRDRFTSVMSWRIESFADVGGHKDVEFLRFLDLPARTGPRFELAVNGPQAFLQRHGWGTLPAMDVSRTPDRYRAFIQSSRGEFGVAKHTYVSTRSGWFSDRTACYLAAGRPAVVQDTAWTSHLPHGEGLLAFSTADEAAEAIARVDADYAHHSARAAALAEEHFEATRVLSALLEKAA
ncbi:MAG TPA: hypothetical protein VFX12_07085 [Vicinamibacterales bacterium]|nr:hypothetical protein [Vicinamibacterales bacterium]